MLTPLPTTSGQDYLPVAQPGDTFFFGSSASIRWLSIPCHHPFSRAKTTGWMLGVWLVLVALANLPAAQAQWTQLGSAITGEAQGDRAGASTSLSSDGLTLALGIPSSGNKPGQVKVYKRVGGEWTQQGSTIPGESIGDQAGYSISLASDGLTLAVGAPISGSRTGYVKVYKLLGGEWTLLGSVIRGDAADTSTGYSVSLSEDGQTLAVGTTLYGGGPVLTKVYRLVGGEWALLSSPIPGDFLNSYRSQAVSLSSDGQTLAVGIPSHLTGPDPARGQVNVYKLLGGEWTQQGSTLPGATDSEQAGFSVSLSADGQTLALGAIGYNTLTGQVKIYTLLDGVWTLLGTPILGEANSSYAGWSVSLSSDGRTLALGAPRYGGQRGQVKVYTLVSGEWTLQGSPIVGDASGDTAGNSVSLSEDGQTLAVGAPGNNSNRGQVKVYQFCNLPVSIGPTAPALCPGTSLTLTASAGADSYTWSTGETTAAITVSPTSTTPYSVTLTNGVCSATAIATVTVNEFTATAGPSSSTALVGSVVSLSATGGTDYLWNAPSGASLSSPATSSAVSATLINSGLNTFTVVVTQGSCSQRLTVGVTAILPSDLTPLVYARPALLYGSAPITVVVDVVETNGVSTAGLITLRITKEAKMSLSLDNSLTRVGGRSVDNGSWSMTTDANHYILTSSEPIVGGGKLSVGLSGQFNAASTTGVLTCSATVLYGSESKVSNNTDADKIEYFQQ